MSNSNVKLNHSHSTNKIESNVNIQLIASKEVHKFVSCNHIRNTNNDHTVGLTLCLDLKRVKCVFYHTSHKTDMLSFQSMQLSAPAQSKLVSQLRVMGATTTCSFNLRFKSIFSTKRGQMQGWWATKSLWINIFIFILQPRTTVQGSSTVGQQLELSMTHKMGKLNNVFNSRLSKIETTAKKGFSSYDWQITFVNSSLWLCNVG